MNPPQARGLTILIAEDSVVDRLLLANIVKRQGHTVLLASNGAEAVEVFRQQRPHLVLMDGLMPVMDGFEATRQIKALAGEVLVPIIFLTSLNHADALIRTLEAGGDDVLLKPYNPMLLAAKITVMDRLRRLQDTVLQQRDQIARHNVYLLNEQRVAKAVFDRVAHEGCLSAPNIQYRQSPYALFNGDLLLAAHTPSGDTHLLLADFTGHGLPAAIGAMPLAEVFYSMTAKGYGLGEMLREMNAKLKRILPVDMFCCAHVVCVSALRRSLEVWSGGMPDGYLHTLATGQRTALSSQHLPLGVLKAKAFDHSTRVLPMLPGDQLFLLTDGVTETTGPDEQLFGAQRLQRVLEANRDPQHLIDEVEQALRQFQGQTRDDVSMVQITSQVPQRLGMPAMLYTDSGQCSPLDWSARFEFRASTLQRFNPLPYLLHMLMEVHGLRAQGAQIHAVLSELYSNALEHGVLGLDSRLKRDAKGFARYYELRNQRLIALKSGFVRFAMCVVPERQGGRLTLHVEDSGPGFDVASMQARPLDLDRLSGRGLNLVRQLCPSARWSDEGRTATVEFLWEALA
ncbi:ATP-binding SpoIIE family protein phosphatase [Pseudomonas helleri]|uniref:ATP-binding SpoIIE family protein phosphatase n=1 Tax=Pseudomonas helleri TaxID=1608996 RepID=UPI0021C7A4AA|nr:fused response regulator/phosphatase [Pseudomonas helleri]MCU1753448.1 fused response regulator/phosphatase [Pseudomonas helleri]